MQLGYTREEQNERGKSRGRRFTSYFLVWLMQVRSSTFSLEMASNCIFDTAALMVHEK